ncbi:MAG: hypothetical protein O2967_14680 [Proteobacteria bacterium]|nr:hypothetical protein [Pseudomonadota bacterium]
MEKLDGRTDLGRFSRMVTAELTASLGRAPGPGERILIGLATVKLARLKLLAEQVLSGDVSPEEADRRCIWFSNSVRRDLLGLGLVGQKPEPKKCPF